MVTRTKRFGSPCARLRISLLCCLTYSTVAFGSDKTYPLEGKIVALGTSQETTSGGTGGGKENVTTILHRTYTVKSSSRIYVLECHHWMNRFHGHSPSECGGKRKIEIGDVIHFRIAEDHAYIQTDKGKEERLNVLSEAMNETSGKQETNP